MLVLSRKKGEALVIAGEIEVVVLDIKGGKVRLGIVADKRIFSVNRKEIQAANAAAEASAEPSS